MQDLNASNIEALVSNKEPEGVSIEYKSGSVFDGAEDKAANNISCDVSAFANAVGGAIIIGIEEDGSHKPRYAGSINGIQGSKHNPEWLQQKLESRLRPVPLGLKIKDITVSDAKRVMVVYVPASASGPIQAYDYIFYARRQYQIIPMQPFEISDVHNRRRLETKKLQASLFWDRGVFLAIKIENVSSERIFDIKFQAARDIVEALRWEATALVRGVTLLNPQESIIISLGTTINLMNAPRLKADAPIVIEYKELSGNLGQESIILNMSNYEGSAHHKSPADYLREELRDRFKDLHREVAGLRRAVTDHLGKIADPTGLALSQSTIRRLAAIRKDSHERVRHRAITMDFEQIAEILECDDDMASHIEHFFRRHAPPQKAGKLIEQDWMTPEVYRKICERLVLPAWCLR